jgi:hypothetical protein
VKEEKRVDAFAVISADLQRQQRVKRRHFTPALLVVIAVALVLFGLVGVRVDLFDQPPWQLVIQVASWVTCLVLFPAIGVGLWFPPRWARVAIAVAGIGSSMLAAVGWPPQPGDAGAPPCAMVLVGAGVLFLGIGAGSGAFAQRRARSSGFWVASGIGLTALAAITWMCPNACGVHVMIMHVAPTAGLVVLGALLGLLLHRRC